MVYVRVVAHPFDHVFYGGTLVFDYRIVTINHADQQLVL